MKINLEKIEFHIAVGSCIHKTRNENCFIINNYKDGKIFFTIPNNKDKKKPYKKSLSIQLIKQIFELENYDFKSFPYKDCRRSAAKGILSLLNTLNQK